MRPDRATPHRPLLLRLEWRVVRRLDGRIQGGYRTPHRGSGLDFAGLRPYVEGDDARHIDWNVTARLDEPQVREFNEDRELTTWLVLDRSASMVVGGPGRGKQDVLAELALILARLLGRSGNRVGAVALRHRRDARRPARHRTRPRAADRPASSTALPTSRAAATTDLAAMLDAVASLARRVPGRRDLGLHRHRRLGTPADAARAPERGRRAAGGRRRRRRAARGRSDRGRGRRDRRAGARRLRRPAGSAPGSAPASTSGRRGFAAGMRRAGVPLHRVDTGSDLVEALVEVVAETRRRRP